MLLQHLIRIRIRVKEHHTEGLSTACSTSSVSSKSSHSAPEAQSKTLCEPRPQQVKPRRYAVSSNNNSRETTCTWNSASRDHCIQDHLYTLYTQLRHSYHIHSTSKTLSLGFCFNLIKYTPDILTVSFFYK